MKQTKDGRHSEHNTFGVTFLRHLLHRRLEKNPGYSLRAFSKSAGVSHSLLSQILSNQRPLTPQTATKIAENLNLSPQQETMLKSHQNHRPTKNTEWTELSLDQYSLIAEWQHFAILSLLEVAKTTLDEISIARRLNISPMLAKVSIERLKRLQYIAKNESGRWKQSVAPFKVENKVSTSATKKLHSQLLKKAGESLREDPIEIRDHSGIVFAFDPKHIPYALEKIRAFRRELCRELEAFGNPEEAYALSIQLFPLSKRGQK